jgi:hypothetical protein
MEIRTMATQLTLPLHRTYRVPAHTFTPDFQTLFEISQVCFSNMPELADLTDADNHPLFGFNDSPSHSIYAYTNWFYDGDDSAFSQI